MEYGQPIRVVSKRTGISPHLIRMWERRYSAINPTRTETGRRLYTDAEIERLILLRRATLEGQSISQIANLSTEQLRNLVTTNVNEEERSSALSDNAGLSSYLDLCIQSMKNFDATNLELNLLRASVNLGQRTFLEKLLHPLLELTGEMWSDGRLNVAHEHLASAVVRSLLGSMYNTSNNDITSPLLISTTPTGQQHEFGALMASVTASSQGWRTMYLGPNMPAEDIIQAVENQKAKAVALSIVYPPNDPFLLNDLRKLGQLWTNDVEIFAGGRSANSYEKALKEINAIKITGLVELRKELEKIYKK